MLMFIWILRHISPLILPFSTKVMCEVKIASSPLESHSIFIVLDHRDTSFVTGGFYSNSFDGTITLSNETWHVEPTRKYGTFLVDAGPSIIYNALDVDMTRHKTDEAFRYRRSASDENDESSSFCGLDRRETRDRMDEERDRLFNDDDRTFKSRSARTQRETKNSDANTRTCCSIYIRVDPTLWDIVYKNEGLNEKGPTIHALVTLIYRTVTAANAIYRSVRFQFNDSVLDRFTLKIKRIRILTSDDCRQTNLSLSETNLCRSYLDSNVLLTWHSAENFTEYCLAYLFTARNFGDGTLGLAWMGNIAASEFDERRRANQCCHT